MLGECISLYERTPLYVMHVTPPLGPQYSKYIPGPEEYINVAAHASGPFLVSSGSSHVFYITGYTVAFLRTSYSGMRWIPSL